MNIMMKLTTTHEIEVNQGIPHYRWIVKDKSGATVLSTKTRDEARNYIREAKKQAREATQ